MLFGLIKPNDWKIVFKRQGTITHSYQDTEISKETYYGYLKYSPSRNKYKIVATIYPENWTNSLTYQKCLDKQIELQKI